MLTVRKNLNVLHICRRVEKVHDSRVEYEKRDVAMNHRTRPSHGGDSIQVASCQTR